jgi:hypothetical protein
MARSVPKKYWKVTPFMLRRLCTSVGRSMVPLAFAEVLVGLRLTEVDLAKVSVGAVVKNHTSAPPFLRQYSAMSLTIDWNDCV